MKIKELLSYLQHRPWPLPTSRWKYYQEWNDTLFMHWRVRMGDLRPKVPADLEIDTFEDSAWVSVVVFKMENIRPRNLPAFSPISNFQEINIRTYVRYKGKSGVYFLNIEAGKRISSTIAGTLSVLPYRYSRMKRDEGFCISQNSKLNNAFNVKYTVGEALTHKSALDKWLTERYALFQDSRYKIHVYEVHHVEWPLQTANLHNLSVSYPKFQQLLQYMPNAVHYSPGVQVLSWDRAAFPKTAS